MRRRLHERENEGLDPTAKNIACQQAYLLYTLNGMTDDTYPVPRRYERKPVRKAVVLVVESDEPEVRHEATTVDMCSSGAKIETQTALTPGQTLSLIQADDPTQAFRCLVVWAGEVGSDGSDQAGLKFLASQSVNLEN